MSNVLLAAKTHTIILLDEIGSGTEPNESDALVIAIMEKMRTAGTLIVATKHYGEIKYFSLQNEGFITAAMKFYIENVEPKYQLVLNKVGESNAFWIVDKMRFSNKVINKAKSLLNKDS